MNSGTSALIAEKLLAVQVAAFTRQIQLVDIIHGWETGLTDMTIWLLIAQGSCGLDNGCLAHLLEHLLLHGLKGDQGYSGGYTTEDYIMLTISKDYSFREIIQKIECLKGNRIGLRDSLRKLEYEAVGSLTYRNELFFRKVWDKTPYEKSPFGILSEVDRVAPQDVAATVDIILAKPMYIYRNHRVFVHNTPRSPRGTSDEEKIEIIGSSHFIFEKKAYRTIYFKNKFDILLLCAHMLRSWKPESYVQAIQKLYMNAFIVEKGFAFPSYEKLASHKTTSLICMNTQLATMNRSFMYEATNELVSIFYTGIACKHRLDRLTSMNMREVSEVYKLLKNHCDSN